MVEFNSIAAGIDAADQMVKTAQVDPLFFKTICPGKFVAAVTGDVAAVSASVNAGRETHADALVDWFIIPNIHRDVIGALAGATGITERGALGIIETFSAASIVVASSVHIAQQWERMVVMRLGKFKCVKGPGFFLTLPFVEYSTMRIDVRIRTTAFGAEETLSNDLVPLDVDAVVFWMVHDAEKACVAVDDYAHQLLLSAQTILRDAIGRATAAEVTARRDQLDRELKRLLEEKVSAWGITVLSVEVRNILLPEELQEVMSLEAQAEQKKKARLILMEAESEISAMIEGLRAHLR